MILSVKFEGDKVHISYPANHTKVKDIERWIGNNLSPGYIEFLLQMNHDPHCNACRDTACENIGMGDDACRGFKFGSKW
jgi:hypothetical protein